MNTKYSEFSRSSLRISQESDGNGPSPFEKLQVGAAKSRFPEQDKFSHYSDVSSKSSEPIARITEGRPVGRQWNLQLKANDEDKFYKKSETEGHNMGWGLILTETALRCYKQLPSAVLENPTRLFFDRANEFINFKGSRKVIDLLLKCRVNFLLTCQGKSRLMKT
ncbi:uncharacterized protein [Malus domestica]|uniref:uncharacterized protein n=1 Tax=Malus domestica TaxID=3750 RepID=UPI00397523BF